MVSTVLSVAPISRQPCSKAIPAESRGPHLAPIIDSGGPHPPACGHSPTSPPYRTCTHSWVVHLQSSVSFPPLLFGLGPESALFCFSLSLSLKRLTSQKRWISSFFLFGGLLFGERKEMISVEFRDCREASRLS